MAESKKRIRLNIYIDDEEMRRQVKIAAARRDLTVTEYCRRAIAEQLAAEGLSNKPVGDEGGGKPNSMAEDNELAHREQRLAAKVEELFRHKQSHLSREEKGLIAEHMDTLRHLIGPIGAKTSDLVMEGRRR